VSAARSNATVHKMHEENEKFEKNRDERMALLKGKVCENPPNSRLRWFKIRWVEEKRAQRESERGHMNPGSFYDD